jgi:hypothetical protein
VASGLRKSKEVDEYIAQQPAEARRALEELTKWARLVTKWARLEYLCFDGHVPQGKVAFHEAFAATA